MRKPFLLVVFAASAAPSLAAQTDYYLRAGVTGSSVLVRDFIAQDVDARPSPGPVLVLGLGRSIAPRYAAGIEIGLATAGLHADYGTTRGDLGPMRTASALAMLDGGIAPGVHWRAGLGFLHYFAGDQGGVFTSGTTRLLIGGGVDYRHPMLRAVDLMVGARYDFHRFTTPMLQSHGYSGAQGVHRISLSVGLARSHR